MAANRMKLSAKAEVVDVYSGEQTLEVGEE
jgi:hypothetical protein